MFVKRKNKNRVKYNKKIETNQEKVWFICGLFTEQSMVTFCVPVPHRKQQVPFFPFSPLSIKASWVYQCTWATPFITHHTCILLNAFSSVSVFQRATCPAPLGAHTQKAHHQVRIDLERCAMTFGSDSPTVITKIAKTCAKFYSGCRQQCVFVCSPELQWVMSSQAERCCESL